MHHIRSELHHVLPGRLVGMPAGRNDAALEKVSNLHSCIRLA